jgi:hypothetical protein
MTSQPSATAVAGASHGGGGARGRAASSLLRKGLAASGDHPGADEVEGEVGYKLEQQINSAASCPKIARYAAD